MTTKRSFWLTPNGLAALGFIGAVSYFLLMEHREHLFAFLPFLILLLCPLMHVFMHKGHGSHDHSGHQQPDGSKDEAYRRGYEAGKKDTDSQSPH